MTHIVDVGSRISSFLKGPLGGQIQSITALSARRTPESIILFLSLSLPSVPVFELFRQVTGDPGIDLTPENLVAARFPILGRPETFVATLFPGLTPGALYWYRVSVPPGPIQLRPIVKVGSIGTLDRTVTLELRDLHVWMDGDEGSPGEIRFEASAMDTERGELLPGVLSRATQSIADGARITFPFDGVLRFAHAPRVLTIGMVAVEDDYPDIIWPGAGLNFDIVNWGDVLARPPRIWDDAYNTYASAMGTADFPVDPGPRVQGGVRLASPMGPLMFEISAAWTA